MSTGKNASFVVQNGRPELVSRSQVVLDCSELFSHHGAVRATIQFLHKPFFVAHLSLFTNLALCQTIYQFNGMRGKSSKILINFLVTNLG